MEACSHEATYCRDHHDAAAWSSKILDAYGLRCKIDPYQAEGSTIKGWNLGPVDIARFAIAGQVFEPARSSEMPWPGDWLFLKLVTSGYVIIEQGGKIERFCTGSLIAMDPARAFIETYPQHVQFTGLRVPKALLHERGLRPDMNGLVLPNVKSADVKATCDLIQCIAEQSDAPSPAVRSRLGEQLLNLMDVVLTDLSAPSRSRSSESLIFRAKRFMERNLENEDLDVSMVASAMHVSAKHLHRLFQAENLSVMRYLWTVRLERAACLLRTRGAHAMSAQEVAYRCGFSSASHFSRAFKDRFRKTPKEYRHIDI